jgi:hypothetical protein
MSDEARDLLVHGVAAANANDREEARYYLEWVLRIDADLDQETEAWYYLSKITDDPVEKRQCLENVLAAYPGHGEARRDLAILEGRLKAEDIIDPNKPVAPITPQTALGDQDLRRYTCPNCGGRLTYNALKGGLACQFCGYRPGTVPGVGSAGGPTPDRPPLALIPPTPGEQDWIAAMYSAKGHRWELPTARTLKCKGCGASVVVPPSQVSTTCPFCGAPHVVVAQAERELIEPEGVVPFRFDGPAAIEHARRWLKGESFRPADLQDAATFSPPRPVYLPFWTFDVNCEVHWSGVQVEFEYRHAAEVPISGVVPVMYDDLLIPGTSSITVEELQGLRFDTTTLTPYSPDLLARWPAEIYSVAMADAAVLAHQLAHDRSIGQAKPGITEMVQGFRVDWTDVSFISFKLVLLPVWITEYVYRGQPYRVLINGQTGETHGMVPRKGIQKLLDGLLGR